MICVILSELISFLVITASNYVLYGHAREGSRAVYDPNTLFLMAEGMRSTAYNSSSPDAEYNKRIWLFGGSTLRGGSGPCEKTIPSCLSRFLNLKGRPFHFTVINFGVNSFNSLLETQYLQKMLIESPEPPDMIIFYDGANDVTYFSANQTPYAHHEYLRTRAFIESYYRSWFGLFKPLAAAVYASFTLELYHKFQEVLIPTSPDFDKLQEMAVLTVQRYDHVKKLSESYGAEFLLVWQPMLWVEACMVSEKVRKNEKSFILNAERLAILRHNFINVYRLLSDRLGSRSYFVGFRDVLCERKTPAYQPDGVHLTDRGREIVAGKLGRLLLERFFKR
jgi:lysophospholipase L1-like esterase